MNNFWILLAGIAAILCVNWYFFHAPRLTASAATSSTGAQEVTITVEGGYTPSAIRVKPGTPLRLTFDRKEKSPCSEELVISQLGIRRFLKPFVQTVIEVPPLEAGTFEFACGMSMLRGQIQVEG